MHGGEEEKRSTGKKVCSQSVEKVWFTDTPKGEDFFGKGESVKSNNGPPIN